MTRRLTITTVAVGAVAVVLAVASVWIRWRFDTDMRQARPLCAGTAR